MPANCGQPRDHVCESGQSINKQTFKRKCRVLVYVSPKCWPLSHDGWELASWWELARPKPKIKGSQKSCQVNLGGWLRDYEKMCVNIFLLELPAWTFPDTDERCGHVPIYRLQVTHTFRVSTHIWSVYRPHCLMLGHIESDHTKIKIQQCRNDYVGKFGFIFFTPSPHMMAEIWALWCCQSTEQEATGKVNQGELGTL